MENARALKKRRCWVCAAGIRSGIRQTSRGFSTRPSFGLAKLIQIVRNTEDEGWAGEDGSVASLPSFRSFFSSSPFFSLPHWFTSSNLPRLVLAPFKKRSCEEGAEMLIIFGINISWEKSYLKN